MPSAAIKNETGKTTLIAAMAVDPIQLPTKMVSINIFNDITNMPIDAGTACLINSFPIDWVPKSTDTGFFIQPEWFQMWPIHVSNLLTHLPKHHRRLNKVLL